MSSWLTWSSTYRRCSTISPKSVRSAPQHLDLSRRPGTQEPEIAADGHEPHTAFGASHRALGVGAVEAGDLAGLATGFDNFVERCLNGRGMRVKFFTVG